MRLLTLNFWGMMAPLSKSKSDRLNWLIEFLVQSLFDIIVLQEVWCLSDYHQLVNALHSHLPYHRYFSSGVVGSGLAVFSHYEIEMSMFHPFQIQSAPYRVWHGDYFAGKGFAHLKLKLGPSLFLNLITTHLIAEYENHDYEMERQNQLVQLLTFTQTLDERLPLLMAGDFNLRPNSVGYSLLKSFEFKDAWLQLHSDLDGFTCHVPGNEWNKNEVPGERIDYVFMKNLNIEQIQLVTKNAAGRWFSDHAGLAAVIPLMGNETMPILNENSHKALMEWRQNMAKPAFIEARRYTLKFPIVVVCLALILLAVTILLSVFVTRESVLFVSGFLFGFLLWFSLVEWTRARQVQSSWSNFIE